MRQFHFYDASTGLLHSNSIVVNAPDHEAVARKNCLAGHEIIEGVCNPLLHRVDLAAVAAGRTSHLAEHAAHVAELRAAFVPAEPEDVFQEPPAPEFLVTAAHLVDYQPPQPSTDHEWNSTVKRWQLSAAAQAKAQARTATIARIAQLEASQHAIVRDLLLGGMAARPRLQAIHDEIETLQSEAGQ